MCSTMGPKVVGPRKLSSAQPDVAGMWLLARMSELMASKVFRPPEPPLANVANMRFVI